MLPVSIEARLVRLIDAYQIHATLPVPIDRVARILGFEIEYRDRIAPIYGMIDCSGGQRRIIVNANLSPAWQRATIAHELGHWIAGHLHEGERKLSQALADDDEEERQAMAVAAALLIPRRILEADSATRSSVAETVDVPRELVGIRFRM